MNRTILYSLLLIFSSMVLACADHDDPQLAPIDTTKVKITAKVEDIPDTQWLNVSEELTVRVSDIEMEAPKGVVLRNISLIANTATSRYTIDDKPYSGAPLVFKVPLTSLSGRVNFSVRATLIKKDSRDAEILIADNIQRLIFSESPQFECEGLLSVSVKAKSTTGEVLDRSFEVRSTDGFTIAIPVEELYWTPSSGSASEIEVSLSAGADAWSPNTTFDCAILKIALGHSSGASPTLRMTIPNIPGSFDAQHLQLYVVTSYFGIWENMSIPPYNLTNVFDITETGR